MKELNLPVSELKEFGVMDKNDSFSKKLSDNDIISFLNGSTIVCDNEDKRITFRLCENNTRLEVNTYEIDKSMSKILNESKLEVAYANIRDISKEESQIDYEKKAYILDKGTQNVVEYDFLKNSVELTEVISNMKNETQINRYKQELLKFKSFLQQKREQYPEVAKYIERDLNVVSKAVSDINNISIISKPEEKYNDTDLYEQKSGNKTEEKERNENLAVQEESKKFGFRR